MKECKYNKDLLFAIIYIAYLELAENNIANKGYYFLIAINKDKSVSKIVYTKSKDIKEEFIVKSINTGDFTLIFYNSRGL